MSFRTFPRATACRISTSRPNSGVQSDTITSIISPPRLSTAKPYLFQPCIRGAKTKTIVKASDLPQGALPPLPPDESQTIPAKSYPTVLQQHLNNVRKFSDCIVLTRVGDFYEMYFDQVEEYAPLVNLKKAKRATALGDVPMAGFQHTQLDRYLKVFVQDLGKQVAISEQIRLPESEKGGKNSGPMYDRKVTRVITAGTLIDESFMDPYENNYLLSVHLDGALPMVAYEKGRNDSYERYKRTTKVGLSWVDLSSGDFFTQVSDLASLPSVVARISPREVVLDQSFETTGQAQLHHLLGDGTYSLHFHRIAQPAATVAGWAPMLEREVPEKEVDSFTACEISSGNLLLEYVRERLMGVQVSLQPPVRRSDDEYMVIDKQSLRGLEIRSTLRDGTFQGSLLHAVRHTVTKGGARLLNQRLVSPSMSLSTIENRLDLVEEMLVHGALREDMISLLRRTADTRRLLQKFSIGKGDADDLLSLARTIVITSQIADVLHEHIIESEDSITNSESEIPKQYGFLWDILARLDLERPLKVAQNIEKSIDEEGLNQYHVAEAEGQAEAEGMADEVEAADAAGKTGPKLTRRASRIKSAVTDGSPAEIWVMRRDASLTLERAHEDLAKLMELKMELSLRLRQQLRAESLTLRWSAQMGHFCHVKGKDVQASLSNLPGARSIGSTKSTRSFYLADWTHLGVRIDDSKLRIRAEEERVFGKLRAEVIECLMKLRRNAAVLDEIDVACSSAIVAKERNLVRPVLHEGKSHMIIGGRHPTVDAGLQESGRLFTPNDCSVGLGNKEKIYLITGPNMAGKSTYLRQNALITILAQTGCFVPAEYAEIGLVDKIFSRVGSADSLHQDQSTFMVEMLETAEILKQATDRSFVIMDEVGRGTTPEDGVAVGYACLHHLHHINQSRTLFATHFHALADMTKDFDSLACYCTDVIEEKDGSWAYVHKLRPGVNRESHALKVARLAGLPEAAISVAGDVLAQLERNMRSGNEGAMKRNIMGFTSDAGVQTM